MWFPSSSEVLAARLVRFRRHRNIEGEVNLPQSPTFRTLSLGETQEHQQQVGTSPNLEGVPATRGTKSSESTSPPLSRIRRPRIFFFPDESDIEEELVSTVALPSGLGNQIPASCSTAPLISPSRMIATASSTDVDHRRTILKVQKSLNLYRDFTKDVTAFNLHVEIADWKEICTALFNMSGTCGNSHPNSISMYDGEMKNATLRHLNNCDHMKHPEERNIASVVPFPSRRTSPTQHFPIAYGQMPWLKGHLFELKEDGSVYLSGQQWEIVYLSGRQWEIVYHSLLRCQEEAYPQQGGFFFSENFNQHCKDHKKGLAPGNVLDGIEEREADELCAMRTLSPMDVLSYMSWEDKFIFSIFQLS
ncbi:hypothetical protein BU17DRAFT_70796 [Hysterangium stoloniferum]|nr:hypothetical protein BU17DRAFT_70796 [Hysterangium stoloniferum]